MSNIDDMMDCMDDFAASTDSIYNIIKRAPFYPERASAPWELNPEGLTNAMSWYFKYHTFPPETLHHDPHVKSNKGWQFAMYLIRYFKILPPPEWRINVNEQNILGDTCATLWLRTMRTEPPEILLKGHDPSLRCYNGFTLAMLYILCLHRLPPVEYLHDPLIQSDEGYTLAMLYQTHINEDIPDILYHNPTIQSKSGYTIEMFYAIKGIVIDKYIHDPELANEYGDTAMFIWIVNNKNVDVPQPLRHRATLQNKNGRTALDVWKQCNTIPPPQYLLQDSC